MALSLPELAPLRSQVVLQLQIEVDHEHKVWLRGCSDSFVLSYRARGAMMLLLVCQEIQSLLCPLGYP